MFRPKWLLSALLLGVFIPIIVVSQIVGPPESNTDESSNTAAFDADEIGKVIETTMECHENPALAVSVVKDGKILMSRGFGTFGLDNPKKVESTSVFGVASLTKLFSATLLIKMLYEKTNLTVDSPVRLLLGKSFNMSDPLRTAETTFTDLLAHKVGIPDYNSLRFDPKFTRDTLLERLGLLQTNQQFRVKYYYSNIMYGLVSYITEVIGGKAWEKLVDEHLYQPLGMKSSTFASVANFEQKDMVVPYADVLGKLERVNPEFSRRWAQLSGSGSVMSSADDMARWMNFHLFDGKDAQGNEVVKAKQIAEIYKGRFFVGPETGKETRLSKYPVTSTDEIYAFGIRRGFYRGYNRLVHTGSTMGYRAYMALLPEPKIGVFIVMTGKDDAYVYRHPLHMYLMDRALGVQSWLNSSTLCTYPEPWENRSARSNRTLNPDVKLKYDIKQYEGSYYNKIFGSISVSYNKTFQALVITYGWAQWRLYVTSNAPSETFYGQGLGANHVFYINPISFLVGGENNNTIQGIKATGMFSAIPPIFSKKKDVNKGTPIFSNSALFFPMAILVCLIYKYDLHALLY
ncbi:unnamed protein product [Lymnaea stagnalis]|uniref:Beta-lactamase-related domain-containing protein n=1 Tax=Lymnaea stagnalis TaxID=6523 RepID=A0AAV2H3A3_LYMST